jgi:plasmid stability protein
MAALTIRNLKESTKQGLRLRAARRGTSMEDEARSILGAVVEADLSLEDLAKKPTASGNAWEGIVELRTKYGALDLEVPERTDFAGSRDIFGAD